jgi:hypothetical protein
LYCIRDKGDFTWSDEAVALFIEIVKARLRGDDIDQIWKEDVDHNVRRHTGRIHRENVSLINVFIYQWVWDRNEAEGKEEEWGPEQYETRIKDILTAGQWFVTCLGDRCPPQKTRRQQR